MSDISLTRHGARSVRRSPADTITSKAWANLTALFACVGDTQSARTCACRTIGDSYATVKAWSAVFKASGRPRDLAFARAAARRIGDKFFRAKAYLVLYGVSRKWGDLFVARRNARRVGDPYFTGKAFSDIAKVTGAKEDWKVVRTCATSLGRGYPGRKLREILRKKRRCTNVKRRVS